MFRPSRVEVVAFSTGLCLLLDSGLAMAGRTPLVGIPLLFQSTDTKELTALKPGDLAQVKIAFKAFADKRAKPELIGENRQDKGGKVLAVTTSGNVADFCGSNMSDLFKKAGLQVVKDGGDVSVAADVFQFQVNEGETYTGKVRLKVQLLDKSGKVLWTGLAVGASAHWGRSYRAANYYETLSDALVSATADFVNDPDFRTALKGGQ
jgi:uncharacterized protein (DUF2147 family)